MSSEHRASISPVTVSDGDRAVFSIDFAEFGLTAPDVPVVTVYDTTGLDIDGADRAQAGVDVTDTVYPDNVPTVSGTVVTLSPFRDPTAGHIYRVWCGVDQGSARLLAYIDITRVLASAVSVIAPPPPLPTAANTMFFTTAVPDVATGIDDDVALVRKSSLVVHAYQKSGGAWTRIWAFSGGDAVLLASGAAVADRDPGRDPITGTFNVFIAVTGYADIDLELDFNQVDPQDVAGERVVTQLSEWRGNTAQSYSNSTSAGNPASLDLSSVLRFGWTDPAYVWFYLDGRASLDVDTVTQNGVDIPVVEQTSDFHTRLDLKLWRSVNTYTHAQVIADPYVVVAARAAGYPATWNRYAAVSQNEVPTEADFLDASAKTSATIRVLIPTSGWGDERRGYLHFALPASQEAPTIAGQPGGINLIDDFVVRSTTNTITIEGDTMRTLSSEQMVFEMADRYRLFAWIIR